jgi:probable addiction module antidote protein
VAKTESYKQELLERLKDPDTAAHYLTACLEDRDPDVFLLALRDVADAHGGLRQISRQTGLNRENLYRMLSKSGNPALRSLDSVLSSLGLRLAVQAIADLPGRRQSRRLRPRVRSGVLRTRSRA